MAAYYNEIDPYAAQWLRNLIRGGYIAPGDVDERDIREVKASDLAGYDQHHFFAGIGGWSYALRLAGWPDSRPVWTGSCPCQPFSVAGKQKGFADERHLWPVWRELIRERRPSVVFGEQVAGASDWLGLVRGDLEEMAYAMGCLPIEAASAGADHFRDRYWFVADSQIIGSQDRDGGSLEGSEIGERSQIKSQRCGRENMGGALADHDLERTGQGLQRGGEFGRAGSDSQDHIGALPDGHVQRSQIAVGESSDFGEKFEAVAGSDLCAVVNYPSLGWGEGWTESEFRSRGFTAAVASIYGMQFVECSDGKWRRLPPPGVRWLGNGIPARVAKLRAFGNAIDPRPAAEFIGAYMTCAT